MRLCVWEFSFMKGQKWSKAQCVERIERNPTVQPARCLKCLFAVSPLPSSYGPLITSACFHVGTGGIFKPHALLPSLHGLSIICAYCHVARCGTRQSHLLLPSLNGLLTYVLAPARSLTAFFMQYVLVNQDKQVQKQILQQFLRHKNYKLPCLLRDEFLGASQLVATALLSLLVCS